MPLPEPWALQIDPDVLKTVRHLPERDAKRIAAAIKLLPHDPYLGDIQKMKGLENVWRRRVGFYRLFYKLLPREKMILVFRLERRTSTTY